ncbi:Translation initiation factor [Melia azedarach]|uniref:Translation initiation factor n=1 Tax=Melia azedarach TaxID=155640 RepID=A0ACC1XVY6_MELAZ|nr:Translation initiation factor [Melia azedarach]
MAKRRGRKAVKKAAPSSSQQNSDAEEEREPEIEDKEAALLKKEVERQSAGVRAIRDVEIEHTLTGLRLLRSYFNEEQLQTPVLQFFKENLPNLSVVRNEENGQLDVQWKDNDGNLSTDNTDGRDLHASLLHRMSLAYPYCFALRSFNGYELSSKAVKTSLLGADNLQIRDFVLEEPSDSHMFGMHNGLQTPGATSQRLSFGMTPKTIRLPKPGEMLLSVHGSPLGVYKEDNMEAIHESEEG